jgi:hypothetical protein
MEIANYIFGVASDGTPYISDLIEIEPAVLELKHADESTNLPQLITS